MPSGKKSKELRRTAAVAAPPPVRSKGAPRTRQANPRVLAIGAGVVVIAVVAIVLGVTLSGGGGNGGALPAGTPKVGDCAKAGLPGCSEVETLFKGIPQNGLYLGSPTAKAQMLIFIDLQCPYCQRYETTIMPTIVKDYVRTGKVRIKVEPWAFIGPDSIRGQKAMFAAAMQNKAWNFAENLYLNQQVENTGWLNDSMVAQAAASVNGLDVQRLWQQRNSSTVASEANQVSALATSYGVTGTPTIFVGKSGAKPKLVGNRSLVPSLAQTEAAIDAAQ
jgi:protein-disulfide isomerase